jgi:non-heme chloroperoxidase
MNSYKFRKSLRSWHSVLWSPARVTALREGRMPTIITRDGTTIFYKDWGAGQPVVFSHGWPLNADIWDGQANLVASDGFRAIAHDRRGHGRSGQTWDGNTMDQYADDLAELINSLDLTNIVLVGHSTGGGEVTRYMWRHGTGRVAKAVLLGAIPPLMLKTDKNPEGTPKAAFDQIRAGLAADRSQFYRDLSAPFYGANKPGGPPVSDGVREYFWLLSMQAGFKGAYDCIEQFSETDFTDDLNQIEVPMLIAHGEEDQIVPIGAAALKTAKLAKNGTLKVYPGAPHGLVSSYEQEFNRDLLAFLKS